MLIECGQCTAPLEVQEGQTVAHCTYCGASNRVDGPTPAPVADPRAASDVGRAVVVGTAATAAGTAGMGGCITVAVLGVLVAVFAGVGLLVWTQTAERDTPGLAPVAPSWDGAGPLRCGAGDAMTVEGVRATLPGQTAVEVSSGCALTLVGVEITAEQGVQASTNASVTLRDCTIVTTGPGVVASSNAEVRLEGTTVRANGAGLSASTNAVVRVRGGSVTGRPAVEESSNGEVLGDLP